MRALREPARAPADRRRSATLAIALPALTAAVLTAGTTTAGARLAVRIHAFLDYYAGVFVLLALTGTVLAGLFASWRAVPVAPRILAQAAHRALGVAALSFLAAHILLEVLAGNAGLADAVVPYVSAEAGDDPYVALGTSAAGLMVVVFASGTARGRFIGTHRVGTWRVIHVTAYLCWPVALVHGLNAGRAPAPWVVWSYVASGFLVLVVALIRGIARLTGSRPRRPVPRPAHSVADTSVSPASAEIPDELFWAELRAEAAAWRDRRRVEGPS